MFKYFSFSKLFPFFIIEKPWCVQSNNRIVSKWLVCLTVFGWFTFDISTSIAVMFADQKLMIGLGSWYSLNDAKGDSSIFPARPLVSNYLCWVLIIIHTLLNTWNGVVWTYLNNNKKAISSSLIWVFFLFKEVYFNTTNFL